VHAAAQLGFGELQVAAGGGIEHQGVAGVPGGGRIQGHSGFLEGAVEIGHQAARRPQRQGQLAQPQTSEAGEAEALLEGGGCFRRLKGCAGQGRQPQGLGAPGGGCAGGRGPEHLGGLHLQQLLVQGVAAAALGDAEFAGADIGHRQAPAAAGALQHHGAEPVVAAGRQQALLEHRAGGEHPGDAALEQFALGGALAGGVFELVAEGNAEAAAH